MTTKVLIINYMTNSKTSQRVKEIEQQKDNEEEEEAEEDVRRC